MTQTSVDDSVEHRVSTVGRCMPHLELKVVDPETGLEVPDGGERRNLRARVQRDEGLL